MSQLDEFCMTNLLSIFSARWKSNAVLMAEPEPSHFGYNLRGGKHRDVMAYNGEVDSLRIRFNGRWGNYVFQMIHMFHIAEKLNINRIYLIPTDVFDMSCPSTIGAIEIRSVYDSAKEEDWELEGVFFSELPLGELVKDLTAERRFELARRYIQPLMRSFSPSTDILKTGSLAIHIRSGDIFQGSDGEGGSQLGGGLYVQPPLSFYLMVVEAAFYGGKGNIFIISENALNPTILPLVAALDRLGHTLSLRLNQELNSDLAWLLAAPKIAFANGTIGMAIALLSTELQEAYFFRHDSTGTSFPVEAYVSDRIRKAFIVDADGGYIAAGTWRNTSEQRCLMCEFPQTKLKWEGTSPFINVALGKPTRQSSYSEYLAIGENRTAVDGNKTGFFSFHTNCESNPWWEVDLIKTYAVHEILVFNRLDVPRRALSMRVFGRRENDEWQLLHDQCGHYFGGLDGNPARIMLRGKLIRGVRIELATTEYLHLDQIEVMA